MKVGSGGLMGRDGGVKGGRREKIRQEGRVDKTLDLFNKDGSERQHSSFPFCLVIKRHTYHLTYTSN